MRDTPDERHADWTGAEDEVTSDDQVPRDAEWEVAAQQPYEPGQAGGLTATIVYAVAEAEGISPADVKSPPLYEVVDTVALEAALFGTEDRSRATDTHSSTEFMYRGFRVVVRSDGWVVVHERSEG